MKKAIYNAIIEEIKAQETRSAWSKGVTQYALELLDSLNEAIEGGYFDAEDLQAPRMVAAALLNGAADWNQYSWGGCSLIYDTQIAERLCNPTELKRTKGGQNKPNQNEEWLDTQARALYQAAHRVQEAIRETVA